ncbi:MAG: hypothetical protein Q8927_07955 [Bacteroidota bacterium]|nr:hypothetical protein [Bacteroidota bacterium]MDP4216121.1 hypothetical protein [Bacteroidota bacterium]MDP4247537.1 hypothetical protein [Bacteroidota bacterium]MDP4252725.1 hypothetical protein [Bacteroidota bacterium]MDP4260465.1 hypothetical protein [Bacteroidota bacterium]
MELIKRTLAAGSFLLVVAVASGQVSPSVVQLQDYCRNNRPPGYSPRFSQLTLTPGGNLHYLFPFYYAFKDEAKFRKIYPDGEYEEKLSQFFAFAGDYRTALRYQVATYDSIDDATRRKIFRAVDGLKDIVHADARRYIHFRARTSRVIMINEARDKPLHRAFTLSLLADLYHEGFRYLAMDLLDNSPSRDLSSLNVRSGYYCAEPVAGELVRAALALGYTLVSYEDTAAYRHTPTERDSIQALNLWNVIRRDTGARMLVHAGYAHISKRRAPDGYIPMGLAFRNLSGLDPLTIDQTDMTEESNFGYGRVFYQAYVQKYPLTSASIPMIGDEPVNVTNSDLYDLAIIHPPTQYQDGRPSWLSLGGLRQPVYVKPTVPNSFLVQAYYLAEIEGHDGKPWHVVPADQTYTATSKRNFLLYLKKGKYTLYFRDMDYRILSSLNIDVD